MSPFKNMAASTHRALAGLRFTAESLRWQKARECQLPRPAKILVSGFMDEALGIGRAGRLTVDALKAMGLDVTAEYLRPLDRGLLTRGPVALPCPEACVWLIHANPPETRIALLRHRYSDWAHKYRIGYWAWESSEAPQDWARTARWLHEIWVPSEHVRLAIGRAFARVGRQHETQKLRVVPHPVAVARNVQAPPVHADGRDADKVATLTLFDPRSDFERKNPMAVIDVWLSLFPQASRTARLIVKTHAGAVHHPRFAELVARGKGRPDIEIMAQTLNGPDTDRLIHNTDILISLHRAEGFGLPLAEAMAAGVSVIATGWSGNMQFMTPENSIPLPYRLVPANTAYNGPKAQWADPDPDAAAQGLKRLIDDPALRERLGAQARHDMMALRENWSPFAPQTVQSACNPV